MIQFQCGHCGTWLRRGEARVSFVVTVNSVGYTMNSEGVRSLALPNPLTVAQQPEAQLEHIMCSNCGLPVQEPEIRVRCDYCGRQIHSTPREAWCSYGHSHACEACYRSRLYRQGDCDYCNLSNVCPIIWREENQNQEEAEDE